MKQSKFSSSQKQVILAEPSKTGVSVEKVCEKYQISAATYYKWQQAAHTNQDETKKRLLELEKENIKLKKMYLEAQLEKEVLTEAVSILKKLQAQDKKTR